MISICCGYCGNKSSWLKPTVNSDDGTYVWACDKCFKEQEPKTKTIREILTQTKDEEE